MDRLFWLRVSRLSLYFLVSVLFHVRLPSASTQVSHGNLRPWSWPHELTCPCRVTTNYGGYTTTGWKSPTAFGGFKGFALRGGSSENEDEASDEQARAPARRGGRGARRGAASSTPRRGRPVVASPAVSPGGTRGGKRPRPQTDQALSGMKKGRPSGKPGGKPSPQIFDNLEQQMAEAENAIRGAGGQGREAQDMDGLEGDLPFGIDEFDPNMLDQEKQSGPFHYMKALLRVHDLTDPQELYFLTCRAEQVFGMRCKISTASCARRAKQKSNSQLSSSEYLTKCESSWRKAWLHKMAGLQITRDLQLSRETRTPKQTNGVHSRAA